MKTKWIILIFLSVWTAIAMAQGNPPPAGAFIYSAGSWIAASSTYTGSPINAPPPVALYCLNSSNQWVPANSSCTLGGGNITWPATGDIVVSNSSNSPAGLAPVNGECVIGSGGVWVAGSCSGSGTSVTSVTGDSNIITNSASTGAVTLSIAGTSGGIPYFASTSSWKTSALLATNALVVGGGAGNAPATGSGDFTYATHTLTGGSSGLVTLAATNALTLSAMTGTACLEEVSGVVTSTGSACGTTSLAFSGLTSGTNSAAAMVVGTGASLTVSGSGTNNATSVNSNTFPASAGLTSGGLIYGSSTSAYASDSDFTISSHTLSGGSSALISLAAANALTLSAMTGTSCLEEVSGVVTATGSACGSGGGTAESSITAPTTTNTITETAAGDWTARNGVETASLTAPWSFSNANSTNNNTSSALIVGVTGSSTGAIALVLNDVSGTGDEFRIYHGSTVSSNALSGGTLEFNIDNSGDVTAAGIEIVKGSGAASTAGLSVTGTPYTGGSTTTNFPQLYVNDGTGPTTFSGSGTEIGVNSPSGFTGNMLDFHVNGGASVAKLDYQGNLTVNACTGCGSVSLAFPLTVSGTTTSGGIPYFSSTTVLSSSAILNSNILVKGGGAGAAPTNSSVSDNGTTLNSTDVMTLGTQNSVLGQLTLLGSSSAGGELVFNGDTGSPGQVTVQANTAGTALTFSSSGSSNITIGTNNSAAGTLTTANGSANADTVWGSAATTSNTLLGPATVVSNGDLMYCVVSSTTCTLTDTGYAYNAVPFSDLSGHATIAQGGTNATSAAAGTVPNATSGTAASWTATPTLGVAGSTAGELILANSGASFSTTLESVATANNTVAFFATAPTTGDLVDCVTSSVTCTLTDSGVLAANVVTASATLTSNAFLTGGGSKTAQAVALTGIIQGNGASAPTVATGHQLQVPLACADSSGSGTAQSCSTGGTTYTPAAGDYIIYTTTTTNSGTGLTVNVNSLGAKSIAIPSASGYTTTLTASIIPANKPQLLMYDGTNWDDQQTGTSAGGGSFPSGSQYQTAYYSAANTGAATSSTEVYQAGTGGTVLEQAALGSLSPYYTNGTYAQTNGSCTAIATSCTITNGTFLGTGPGIALLGYDGGNPEMTCFTAATSTTITFGNWNSSICSSTGRAIWGSTAQAQNSGWNILLIIDYSANNATTAPNWWVGQDGNIQNQTTLPIDDGISGGFVSFANPALFSQGLYVGSALNTAKLGSVNSSGLGVNAGNGNAALVTNSSTESRNVSTQSITSTGTFATNATAITAAVTPAYPNNGSAASNTVHGQLESDCEIVWEQLTAPSTAQFGVKLSAAPTSLTVIEEDWNGTSLVGNNATVITGTTVTATSGTITPANFASGPYWSTLKLIMNPGTTNSPTVTLYANSGSASDAVQIQAQTGCGAWH